MTDDANLADAGKPAPMPLDRLRRDFDQSFAVPPRHHAEDGDEFIAVRVGGAPHALAIPDLARLERAGRVVPLPAGRPGLLGIAGVRGRLVPVFALAPLLGLPDRKTEHPWLAMVDRDDPIAFAFDSVEGYLKATREAAERIEPAGATAGRRPYVRCILRWPGAPPRLVIDIPRLAAALRAPARTGTT